MKRFFTLFVLISSFALSTFAVSVSSVLGTFKGTLNIAGTQFPNKEVYILPGVESNTITFVLPDFKYNNASLGDIVLVNIPMSTSGTLTLDQATLYIKAIKERAEISVLNGFKDGSDTYNSVLSTSQAQVLLSIAAPSLPEPILVFFAGNKVANENYAVVNGGFEGNWSNGEPNGWHSFNSATGSLVSYVQNTEQFTKQSEVRPGSKGSQSAMIKTKIVVGNNANGNCTNGQINAGSMTATDASGNYNFSDPSNNGYNTSFVGNPDSLVFWAKYIPADKNPSNSVNKARAHAVITTSARYQDPEASNYSAVKIAEATLNYSATQSMGWQRLAIPFVYSAVDPSQAAYMLITFTTNYQPGGGSSYSEGVFNKTYYLDNVYLDDVEMVYNHSLKSLTMDGNSLSFSNGQANSSLEFSDSDHEWKATTNGKASKSFIGFDAINNRVYVYVVADNYSQAYAYSVYTVQMAEPIPPVVDTEYAYAASICTGETYSDNLFKNLSKAGEYTTTIPNKQGGDSLITFTLSILPTYSFPTKATIRMDETYSWRGKEFKNPKPGVYKEQDALKTKAGCDSIYTLELTVKPIGYEFEDQLSVCRNEEAAWRGKKLPTSEAGTVMLYDSLKSIYNMDSVYVLSLTVLPDYTISEIQYVNTIDIIWHGQPIKDLQPAVEPYIYYDSLKTLAGCDSVLILSVYVSEIPVTYGVYEVSMCDGEEVEYEGEKYTQAFDGNVHVAKPNVYGGDSVVHLTVTVLPNYTIDEYMTITIGDEASWEGWDLSMMEVGELTLSVSYYTEYSCDSTLVLHLTVNPKQILTDLPSQPQSARNVHKILWNGRIYIIREDDAIYDILGTKIK